MQRRLQVLRPSADESAFGTAVRVAFASTDMKRVDQHFGMATSFAIFTVDGGGSALLEVVQFGSRASEAGEDKLASKVAALQGCVAVYVEAAGASAIRRLREKGIQPIKVNPNASIGELLQRLQGELRGGASVWLARAVRARKPVDHDRFEQMESEGWQE